MTPVTTPSIAIGQQVVTGTLPIETDNFAFPNAQEIVTLSDGTLMAVYRRDEGIFFQQFDRVGNTIGGEGQLDAPNFEARGNFDVLAVEDGKIVLAFEANLGGNFPVLRVKSFSVEGGVATATTDIDLQILSENNGTSAGDFRDASLAGSSISDVTLHTLQTALDGTQSLTVFSDLTEATPQSADHAFPFVINRSAIETAVLDNGNTVTAVISFGAGGTDRRNLDFIITAPDGTEVARGTARVTDGTRIEDTAVAALSDGGFAVVFGGGDGNDIDQFTQTFDADGTARAPTEVVFSNNPDANRDPTLIALEDGGYVIFFVRDKGTDSIIGQRFDANGQKVGTFFIVETGSRIEFTSATMTEDGLIAVSYAENQKVAVELIATEALDIVLTDADEAITGTVDDDFIDAKGGTDIINAGEGDDFIIGGAGADDIDGGAGFDTLSYADSGAGVNVDLVDGEGSGGDAGGDDIAGIEALIGSAFADTLSGDGADNTLEGGLGNDLLAGNGGTDLMNGGAGTDTASYALSTQGVLVDLANGVGFRGDAEGDTLISIENLIGGDGDDTLIGSSQANVIEGGTGGDAIFGGGGNDTLTGDAGNDLVLGDGGKDRIDGGIGDDRLLGGGGSDIVNGGDGNDTIGGGGGNDTLNGGDGNDTINGGAGADTINGGAGDDILKGGDGNDILTAGQGSDQLFGGNGNDQLIGSTTSSSGLFGGNGNDRLVGGDAIDRLEGGNDDDTLLGGDNDDLLFGDGGNDFVFGESGKDRIEGGDGNDHLDGGADDDDLSGGDGNDTLIGAEGNDTLNGGAGDDTLIGGGGIDLLVGGGGRDTADYTASNAGVDIDLASAATGVGGDAQGDGFQSIENLIGSAFDDILTGDTGRNELKGGDGNDTLDGKAGDDTLHGGKGNDTLTGGSGADVLNGAAGADVLNGGGDDDTLNGGGGNDVADGGGGNDLLNGNNGDDTLNGGAGADRISGGAGKDRIRGDAGDDRLTGGDGADRFIFADGFGKDVIVDFETGADRINLASVTGITDFADLGADHMTQSGADVIISDGIDEIRLRDVQLGDFTASDFIF